MNWKADKCCTNKSSMGLELIFKSIFYSNLIPIPFYSSPNPNQIIYPNQIQIREDSFNANQTQVQVLTIFFYSNQIQVQVRADFPYSNQIKVQIPAGFGLGFGLASPSPDLNPTLIYSLALRLIGTGHAVRNIWRTRSKRDPNPRNLTWRRNGRSSLNMLMPQAWNFTRTSWRGWTGCDSRGRRTPTQS